MKSIKLTEENIWWEMVSLEFILESFAKYDILSGIVMGIDDISLCTIFVNTLDNAIEACRKMEKTEDRKLSAKARYTEKGYFSYEIINSKKNKICEKKVYILRTMYVKRKMC